MEEDKIKFTKIFAGLPEKIKSEDIIVVIDENPYTWSAAYFEINNDSEIGKRILKKLKDLEII